MTPRQRTFLSLLILSPLLATAELTTTQDCTCFTTNSSTPYTSQLYTHYQFFDFRKFGRTSSSDYINQSAWVTPSQDLGTESPTDSYFSSSAFKNIWDIQTWTTTPKKADLAASTEKVVNSARNIYISRDEDAANNSHVTFRTISYETFQSTSEMQTKDTYMYASVRARARVSGAAGAVAGIFLYHDDSNESDIEILTSDKTSVFRATNNPDVDPETGNQIPGASTIDNVPGINGKGTGGYTQFNDYRLDWFPTRSDWYINGKLIESKSYGVPKTECNFMINMWSNGGIWSGNMTEDKSAYLDLQWLEMVYNTTSDDAGKGCEKKCDVDGANSGGIKVIPNTWVWMFVGVLGWWCVL